MSRLPLHALVYTGLLALVAWLVPLDASLGSDDGAYGAQVHALRQGSWVLERPVPVVGQDNEGWLNAAITPQGPTPYTTNPLYPRLLQAVAAVTHGPTDEGEPAGAMGPALHLPGFAAAVASACLAWALAGRWDRRARPLAFWLLALGPILVNATSLWAHAISTAVGGVAVLAVVKAMEQHRLPPAGLRSLRWALVLAGALAAGAAVRTEAVFWTVGLLVSALVVDRSRAMVATVAGAGITALAVTAANRWWGRTLRTPRVAVETSVEALEGTGSWLATRLPAAWQLLMTRPEPGAGALLALLGATIALAAAVLVRREKHTRTVTAGPAALLALAATTYGIRAMAAPGTLITGLLAAWPLVPVALVAGRWPAGSAAEAVEAADSSSDGPAPPVAARWLLAPVALLTAAVLVTQYASSGGLQWGGRYLSMAYVPLATAAGLRLVPLLHPDPDPDLSPAGSRPTGRKLLPVALAALTLAPALGGAVASHRLHTTHAEVVAAVTARPAQVVVTEIPALPRIAWTALPTTFYRADATTVETLLAQLARAGVVTVNVQGSPEADLDGMAGYRVTSTDGSVRHLTLSPPP